MLCTNAINTSNTIEQRPVPAERHSSGLYSNSLPCNFMVCHNRTTWSYLANVGMSEQSLFLTKPKAFWSDTWQDECQLTGILLAVSRITSSPTTNKRTSKQHYKPFFCVHVCPQESHITLLTSPAIKSNDYHSKINARFNVNVRRAQVPGIARNVLCEMRVVCSLQCTWYNNFYKTRIIAYDTYQHHHGTGSCSNPKAFWYDL